MKITIEIPESAIDDVKEYCRIEKIDLHARMQQELINFVANAKQQMSKRRQAEETTNAD